MEFLRLCIERIELPEEASAMLLDFLSARTPGTVQLPENITKAQRKQIHRLCDEVDAGGLTHRTVDGFLVLTRFPRIVRKLGADLRYKLIRGFMYLESINSTTTYLEATRLGFEKAVLGLSLDLQENGKPNGKGNWEPITTLVHVLPVYGVGKFQHPNLSLINVMDYAAEELPPKGKFDSAGPALLVALYHLHGFHLEKTDDRSTSPATTPAPEILAASIQDEARTYSLEEITPERGFHRMKVLVTLKFVESRGNDVYALTPAGKELAARLKQKFKVPDPLPKLPAEDEFEMWEADEELLELEKSLEEQQPEKAEPVISEPVTEPAIEPVAEAVFEPQQQQQQQQQPLQETQQTEAETQPQSGPTSLPPESQSEETQPQVQLPPQIQRIDCDETQRQETRIPGLLGKRSREVDNGILTPPKRIRKEETPLSDDDYAHLLSDAEDDLDLVEFETLKQPATIFPLTPSSQAKPWGSQRRLGSLGSHNLFPPGTQPDEETQGGLMSQLPSESQTQAQAPLAPRGEDETQPMFSTVARQLSLGADETQARPPPVVAEKIDSLEYGDWSDLEIGLESDESQNH